VVCFVCSARSVSVCCNAIDQSINQSKALTSVEQNVTDYNVEKMQ